MDSGYGVKCVVSCHPFWKVLSDGILDKNIFILSVYITSASILIFFSPFFNYNILKSKLNPHTVCIQRWPYGQC